MATIFMMNEEIARGMVCFFHQKKHSYLIFVGHGKENLGIFYSHFGTFKSI
jgi:hypothetical protein